MNTPSRPLPPIAFVELMGHDRIAGKVLAQRHEGIPLLCVTLPPVTLFPGSVWETHFPEKDRHFGPNAIFGVQPATLEAALAARIEREVGINNLSNYLRLQEPCPFPLPQLGMLVRDEEGWEVVMDPHRIRLVGLKTGHRVLGRASWWTTDWLEIRDSTGVVLWRAPGAEVVEEPSPEDRELARSVCEREADDDEMPF